MRMNHFEILGSALIIHDPVSWQSLFIILENSALLKKNILYSANNSAIRHFYVMK